MSTKEDSFPVRPSQPEMISLPSGIGLWIFCKRAQDRNSRRAGGLRKPSSSHAIYALAPMSFVNDLVDLCLRDVHHRCFERFRALSVLELHFTLLYFV